MMDFDSINKKKILPIFALLLFVLLGSFLSNHALIDNDVILSESEYKQKYDSLSGKLLTEEEFQNLKDSEKLFFGELNESATEGTFVQNAIFFKSIVFLSLVSFLAFFGYFYKNSYSISLFVSLMIFTISYFFVGFLESFFYGVIFFVASFLSNFFGKIEGEHSQ